MTNDIVKIKSVAASQGGETEHGLMLDSSILSYTYQGSSKTVKWILDTIFTLLGGKAASVHTHTKSQITDFAHTHAQSDITGLTAALDEKADLNDPIFTGSISLNEGNDGYIIGVDESGHHGLSVYSDDGAMKSKIILDSSGTIEFGVLDEEGEDYVGLYLYNTSFGCNVDTVFSSDVSFESGLFSGDSVEVSGDLSAYSFSGDGVESTPTLNHTNKIVSSHGIASALAGKANSSHTHSQSDITGLSTALANKLSSSVHYELLNTSSAKKNLSSMTIGDLYLFKNQYSKQLSQIINNDVIGANLYFHQGAGSIATDYIMVRIYKWVLPDDTDERLCEIVGAWDA